MNFTKDNTVEELRQHSYVNLVDAMLIEADTSIQFDQIVANLEKALELELTDMEVSQLYTDITIDGRFIPLSDGSFNLRTRHKFEDFQVEMFLYDEDDEKILEEFIEAEEELQPLESYEDEEGVVSLDVLKQKEALIENDEYEM